MTIAWPSRYDYSSTMSHLIRLVRNRGLLEASPSARGILYQLLHQSTTSSLLDSRTAKPHFIWYLNRLGTTRSNFATKLSIAESMSLCRFVLHLTPLSLLSFYSSSISIGLSRLKNGTSQNSHVNDICFLCRIASVVLKRSSRSRPLDPIDAARRRLHGVNCQIMWATSLPSAWRQSWSTSRVRVALSTAK